MHTYWSLQFNMNYLKQTLGSAGQPSVWGECLMIVFYCSRRSRSSKLSFCSPQGARAAAVRIHSALCFYTRGEVGQARSLQNVFTGGRHSVDAIILLFCPFVPGKQGACESSQIGRHLSPVWRWSNSSLAWFSKDRHLCVCALFLSPSLCVCVCAGACVCMRVNRQRKNRPPLRLKIKCLFACSPLMDCVGA